jgi:hypothetical protein
MGIEFAWTAGCAADDNYDVFQLVLSVCEVPPTVVRPADETATKCRRTVRFTLVGPAGLGGQNVNNYNKARERLSIEYAFYAQS